MGSKTKITGRITMNYFILLLSLFVLLGQCNALSENIIVDGKINAWHDGIVKDRASGTGFAEYSVEQYAGGMSSGFNLTGNGQWAVFLWIRGIYH